MKNNEIPHGYLRVTEVLQPFSNFDGIDAVTLANAANRGSRVHSYCEAHALGLFVEEIEEDCKNYVEVFKTWFDEMVTKVLHTEVRLNSERYRISGAFDLIAILKGDTEPSLIDYKTPLTASPTWQLQTAAYRILIEEELKLSVSRRLCVMLPKYNKDVKIVEFTNHLQDQQLYLKALELYRFFNG